jgi:hypothetical protein
MVIRGSAVLGSAIVPLLRLAADRTGKICSKEGFEPCVKMNGNIVENRKEIDENMLGFVSGSFHGPDCKLWVFSL